MLYKSNSFTHAAGILGRVELIKHRPIDDIVIVAEH